MSTTTKRLGGDRWIQIPATWGLYLRLLRERGERPRPVYTFCDGRLTIVSPGVPHEAMKERLSGLLDIILVSLDVDFLPRASLTLKEETPGRKGTEPDSCYYLTNLERVRGKKRLKMGIDPAPDLALEVVVTHPVRDALKAHAAFGVREVWVCKEGELQFLVLGEGGRYSPSPASVCLPFLISEELAPWVFLPDDPYENKARRAFQRWVNEVLSPRYELWKDRPNP